MNDIQRFITGFDLFRKQYYASNPSVFEHLKATQNPNTMIVGCCDSRVDPALLTGCDPGEIFIVRNVGNLVPPFENDGGRHGVSAALEFAICNLKVENIIVLGHSGCGGIKALLSGNHRSSGDSFVERWVSVAIEVRDRILEEHPDETPAGQQRAAEQASVLHSVQNLHTFPFVRERLETGVLSIFGWYFDITGGELLGYDRDTGLFSKLCQNNTGITTISQSSREMDEPDEK